MSDGYAGGKNKTLVTLSAEQLKTPSNIVNKLKEQGLSVKYDDAFIAAAIKLSPAYIMKEDELADESELAIIKLIYTWKKEASEKAKTAKKPPALPIAAPAPVLSQQHHEPPKPLASVLVDDRLDFTKAKSLNPQMIDESHQTLHRKLENVKSKKSKKPPLVITYMLTPIPLGVTPEITNMYKKVAEQIFKDIEEHIKAKNQIPHDKFHVPFVIKLAKAETELEKSQQKQFLEVLSSMKLNVKYDNLFIPIEIKDANGMTLNMPKPLMPTTKPRLPGAKS